MLIPQAIVQTASATGAELDYAEITTAVVVSASSDSYAYIAIYETALPNSVIMSHSHQLGLS